MPDSPEILYKLVEEGLVKAELEYKSGGWAGIERHDQRPDTFYSLNLMEPEGQKEPTKKQAGQLQANRKAQKKISMMRGRTISIMKGFAHWSAKSAP